MNNEQQSIHAFDFNLICEFFSLLERQGPGSPETTIRALGYAGCLTEESRIADIGCGTGGQTIVLAQHTPGNITGVDLYPPFVDKLNRNAQQLGLYPRVKAMVGSMESLPFQQEELDLIWSEGAIYHMGFSRGLTEWHHFLKPGGFVAVSEATWFTETRPKEIQTFWQEAYPEMDTLAAKTKQMKEAGYEPVASFALPETCWTEHFYAPQQEARKKFLQTYKGNPTAEAFIAGEIREQELYCKYKEFYGYVFYIGRKI